MRLPSICLILFFSLSCESPRLEPIDPPPGPFPGAPESSGSAPTVPKSPPGYSGPIASPEARVVLGELSGKTFTDTEGTFGRGEWTVGRFSVTPYPGGVRAKGPNVALEQGLRVVHLPMEADGDAADLFRRVTGQPHPTLDRELSQAYRANLARWNADSANR